MDAWGTFLDIAAEVRAGTVFGKCRQCANAPGSAGQALSDYGVVGAQRLRHMTNQRSEELRANRIGYPCCDLCCQLCRVLEHRLFACSIPSHLLGFEELRLISAPGPDLSACAAESSPWGTNSSTLNPSFRKWLRTFSTGSFLPPTTPGAPRCAASLRLAR